MKRRGEEARSPTGGWWLLGMVALVLLLAFFLRVYKLDGQSLWSDEGASAVMAQRSVPQILEAAAGDIHPPLYYLLLRAWSLGTGLSEYALRYLSLMAGMVLVANVLVLGRRLFGVWVGLAATLFAALSPLLIYYAQEARMYALLATLTTLLGWVFLRLLSGNSRHRTLLWPTYVLLTTAALYTQYFALTVVLFLNLAFAVCHWRFWQKAPHWAAWIAAQVAVCLLFLPWLWRVWGQVGAWQAAREPLTLTELAIKVFRHFSFNSAWDVTATPKAVALLGILAAASLGYLFMPPPKQPEERVGRYLFVVGYLVVPVLALYGVSLNRPLSDPKFLLPALPAYVLLLGLGVVSVARLIYRAVRAIPSWSMEPLAQVSTALAALVLMGAVGYVTQRSFVAYYHNPKYARDDYRSLVRTIALSAQPKDAILLNAPGQIEIFNYYYRGALPRYPLPQERPLNVENTVRALEEIAAQRARLWVVAWAVPESDPDRFIEKWLSKHAYRAASRWFGGVQLVLYRLPGPTTVPVQPLDLRLGDHIRLTGYRLETDRDAVAAGDTVGLTLFWRTGAALPQRYTVFAHLVDEKGYLWGQHDGEPGGGLKLTTTWKASETVEDLHGIPVLWGTPPGEYRVEVGLYEVATGQRIPIRDLQDQRIGNRVLLGSLRVERAPLPPDPEGLMMHQSLSLDYSELILLGYDLTSAGSDQPQRQFAGQDVPLLTLYWQAKVVPSKDAVVSLRLEDATGKVALTRETRPVEGRYPSSSWIQGEVVRDQHRLSLGLAPGNYRLLLGLKAEGAWLLPKGRRDPWVLLTSLVVR